MFLTSPLIDQAITLIDPARQGVLGEMVIFVLPHAFLSRKPRCSRIFPEGYYPVKRARG